MRARLEKWLIGIWYADTQPPWFLRQLEAVYRRALPTVPQKAKGLTRMPLVVVGNITAGGTGKTPLVIALCKQLQAAGFRPAVISRGYGRKTKGLHIVHATDEPLVCGDESLLIKQETGVPVVLAEDRRLAISALDEHEIDIIIADDGLQNTRLNRDFEICLIDGERLLGNGHLLPAGPLREPVKRLSTVDYLVVNGSSDQLQNFLSHFSDLGLQAPAAAFSMALVPSKLEALRFFSKDRSMQQSSEEVQSWKGKKVHAVAAIGNPGRFCKSLEALGMQPLLQAFPDHHQYRVEDFSQMRDLPIIMTAKDAIKCTGLGLDNAWVLSVEAEVDAEAWAGLICDINRLIENQSGSQK
ncbi:MAG: tetraacyldisaccharide 4'-kinase [Xanthomonadales bacterium]|nr:tetraacyldisaccharide 4'-kinase [Xanthomonadales bacterium]